MTPHATGYADSSSASACSLFPQQLLTPLWFLTYCTPLAPFIGKACVYGKRFALVKARRAAIRAAYRTSEGKLAMRE